MEHLLTVSSLAALATLTLLEVVLGVDNLVFIAILTGKLPPEKQNTARRIGLALAALGRIVLLLAITWVITLDKTVLFETLGHEITVKDLILILGGAFLVAKATWEIHHSIEGHADAHAHAAAADGRSVPQPRHAGFGVVIAQILALDLVFSIDSVLTAVGMVRPEDYPEVAPFPGTTIPWPPLVIMIAAIAIAIAVMLIFVGPISRFVNTHPTVKMLALAFLILIGVVLVAEGLHQHIPRGYIYAAMGFSLFVEMLNMRATAKRRAAVAAHA